MKHYYQDDYCTIYHADCRELLPHLRGEVQLAMVDPPYGIDGGRGTTSKARGKGNYASSFPDTPDYVANVVVGAIEWCIDNCRTTIVTPGCANLASYPQANSFGCFYQPTATGMQRFGNMDAQPILYYGTSAFAGKNLGRPCSFTLTEPPSCRTHPCSKPIKAWGKIMHLHCADDDVVFDPFMGSGTTLRAAKDLRRKCIGIELEEKYCEIAAKRMAQEVLAL